MILNKAPCNDSPRTSDHKKRDAGSLLSVLASFVWLAVAAIIASVFGKLMAGTPVSAIETAVGVALLWVLRAALDMAAQGCLAQAADARIDTLRREILSAEAQRPRRPLWAERAP